MLTTTPWEMGEVSAGQRGEVAERSKALRQGRNLFGGVGSNPTLVTFSVCDRMAEWSKAPDPSSGLSGGAGSNPAPVTFSGDGPGVLVRARGPGGLHGGLARWWPNCSSGFWRISPPPSVLTVRY